MNLQVLSLEQFNLISENAHMLCFNEKRPPEKNTFDYALLITNEENEIFCYSTIINLDDKTCYMQHGGAMPKFRGSIKVIKGYGIMVSYLKERYKRISTRVHNQNIRMLKLAFHEDLIIVGMDVIEKDLFLNLNWSKPQ